MTKMIARPDENALKMERATRLRDCRKAANFKSAAKAAAHFGWAYGTYSGHENGARGFDERDCAVYARSFGVSPQYLWSGTVNPIIPNSAHLLETFSVIHYVPVLDISDLATFETFMDGTPFPDTYPREPLPHRIAASSNAFSVNIVDAAMAPKLEEGMIAFFDRDQPHTTGHIVAALVEGYPMLALRKFRLMVGEGGMPGFELLASNEDYPSFSSIRHKIRIVGRFIGHWVPA